MLHYDKGTNVDSLKSYFDKFRSYGIPIDIIGVSYYPWWHGSLLDLREGLNFLAAQYDMDVVVVETAYHWAPTPELEDIGPIPFPTTPEGQRDFLEAVNQVVLSVPENRGKGIFWWEPMVNSRFLGTRSFFNEKNEAMPVLGTFDAWALPWQTKD